MNVNATPSGETWGVNAPAVAFEIFDREAILIHFTSGHYFALNECAKDLWSELVRGTSVAALAALLERRHGIDAARARDDAERFVARLRAHDLVRASDREAPAAASEHGGESHAGGYVAPAVEVFTDMQELLLLDPVHEVDEHGWPNAR